MSNKQAIIRPQAGFQEKFVRTNVDFCVGGGVLNCQPKDSLVATPNGFVRIGDLKAGDVVCNTNGGTQIVNFVIDKGVQPCVEFTLSDGRKVCSDLTHKWLVKEKHGSFLEKTTKEVVEYIDKEERKRNERSKPKVDRLRIPLPSPCYFNDCYSDKRTIHPYVLGFLLGDGCLSSKGHSVYISVPKSDYSIVEYIQTLGYKLSNDSPKESDCAHYGFRGGKIRGLLKDLGLLGKLSYDKFIPNVYKFAPVEDRVALLQGLFDSDGTCEKNTGQVSIHSTSKQLIKDVQFIIHSLGGIANFTTYKEKEGYIKGEKYLFRENYVLRVRIDNDKKLFHLDRKKRDAKTNEERRQKLMLSIVSYKKINDQEVRCINVSDEEHLYLTNDFVTTCNCGKTFAAVLSVAEPSLDGRFRGLFLRNNLGDAKAAGGILDTFKDVYADSVEVVESGEPRVTFPSGAKIDVTHVADQSYSKVMQRFKGRQYDFIYFDEGTGFEWSCFTAIYTRNRGTASWTGKVRMTTNPDKNHWLREFIDWYIGADGFIREDREGVVRYFYIAGETVKDVVWGDTKEEVYRKCRIDIDRKLAKINGMTGKATYRDMIKSFTFYLGRMSENKASIGNNGGYAGSVAVSGGRNAEQLLEGNWNVSPNEDLDAPISSHDANQVFMNDPQRNNDRWVTCDLADTGTDNFLCLAWDGFHIFDYLILKQSTPRQNAERLEMFAAQYNISNTHIIYDAIRGTYINDYIPDAIPFFSYYAPRGLYGRMAYNLKAECYMRLVEAIKQGYISFSEEVANRTYEHQKLRTPITIQNEFIEECLVVRFKDMPSGKKALFSKKEMNAKLGKDRSMDLLDPCAMRFLPCLEYPYGEELEKTTIEEDVDSDDDFNQSIFDETLYG